MAFHFYSTLSGIEREISSFQAAVPYGAADALTTTSLGRGPDICASTATSATGAAGLTPSVTAPPFPNIESKLEGVRKKGKAQGNSKSSSFQKQK